MENGNGCVSRCLFRAALLFVAVLWIGLRTPGPSEADRNASEPDGREIAVAAGPGGSPQGIPGAQAPASTPAEPPLPAVACDSGAEIRPADIPPRAGHVMNQAQQRIQAGKNDEAVQILQKYLVKHPESDCGLLEFLLGNALYAAGQPGNALDAFRKSVHLDPCQGPAWVNLGQVAMEREDYSLAGEALQRGYDLQGKKNPEYLYYAAVAHVLDGRHERAVPLLESLLGEGKAPPNPEWMRTLLHAYMELGRNDRAAALLDRMLAAFPGDPEMWRVAYRFDVNRQNFEQAAVALTVLGYLTELTREERLLLADLYAAIHVPRKAADLYEAALKEGASDQEYERLAVTYLSAHCPEEASRTLRRAVEQQPGPKLWMLLGEVLCEQENYPGAFDAFRESARLDPAGGRALLMMGYCALQMDRNEEAVLALERAVKDPKVGSQARPLLEQARSANAQGGEAPPSGKR
jgi:tetratricopeptide (TPR) repeat protein